MKIISVVGARPQFIKVAPVARAIARHNANHQSPVTSHQSPITIDQSLVTIHHLLVHTGQHYDIELSRIFFDELGIPRPDYNLGVGSDTHARQTARMMIAVEDTLVSEKPDLVLVYGDTNSTLAGALAAVKLHIPVAHVEAGPRMFDKSIPEEVNRVLTDHVSSVLFAPTQTAVDNLKREGITRGVYLTGDVMLDSFLHFSSIAAKKSTILQRLQLSRGEYMLATVHRAGNTDNEENLRNIIEAFLSTGEKIVFPVHPRTRKMLKEFNLNLNLNLNLIPESESHSPSQSQSESESQSNVLMIPPVGYLDSIMLTRNARKVLTDSGGLQKEAYFSKVPCITLDEATGWPETVEDGWNVLVGSDKGKIIEAVKRFELNGTQRAVFGDGRAGVKIATVIAGGWESTV
jgi:UDP-GlcNAc3NAcA epimerase